MCLHLRMDRKCLCVCVHMCRYISFCTCVFIFMLCMCVDICTSANVCSSTCLCVCLRECLKCKRMSKGHRRKTKDHRWEKPDTCGRHCDGEIKAVITRQVTRRWTENSSQCSSIKLHFARVFISCSKRYPTCLHSECTAVLLTMEETL